jgi:hypothetical protein
VCWVFLIERKNIEGKFMSISEEDKIFSFLKDWEKFSNDFSSLIDELSIGWCADKEEVLSIFKRKKEDIKEFFLQRASLRRQMFYLGESNLIPCTIYSWEKLKVDYPDIQKIGFLTPFSVALDISSPIDIFHITKSSELVHPTRVALFVAEDFIEHLIYKYPSLENLIAQNNLK